MAPIHIDEASGSDDSGKGTQEEPYQSLGQALFIHGPAASYLIRKDPTAQYDEPTQSSLKKAKKTADGIEKKRKKQEELAERDAKEKGEEKEKREKLLEESKKIILEEDVSLLKATKVSTRYVALYSKPFDLRSFIVENCTARRATIKTNSYIWMGASSTPAKRYNFHSHPGWNRLSSNGALWTSSKSRDIYRTENASNIFSDVQLGADI